jgi:hypothetical protein
MLARDANQNPVPTPPPVRNPMPTPVGSPNQMLASYLNQMLVPRRLPPWPSHRRPAEHEI